jgi:hypothetical protein
LRLQGRNTAEAANFRWYSLNSAVQVVFDAISQLMTPPEPRRKQIGFHAKALKRVKNVHKEG